MPPKSLKYPKKLPIPAQKTGSDISNTEWGLLIGATAMVDLIQLILNFFAVGVFINRFLNILMGMSLGFYFWARGMPFTSKKVAGMIGSFVGEMIPVIDSLPLWTMNVVYTMLSDKIPIDLPGSGTAGKK